MPICLVITNFVLVVICLNLRSRLDATASDVDYYFNKAKYWRAKYMKVTKDNDINQDDDKGL